MDGQKSLYSCGFAPFRASFPLDRGRGFTGDVVTDAVDALDFIDNSGGNAVQYVIGDPGPVGGHKVAGGDGPESQGIVIGAPVAHDAYGAGVGKHRKILVQILVLTGFRDLVPEDKIGLPEQISLLLGNLPNDADGQTGAGEGLAEIGRASCRERV